jgi:hypothetical protein
VYAVLDRDGKSLPFVPLDAVPGYWRLLARAPEGGSVTVRLAGGGATSDVVGSSDGAAAPFDGVGALLAADTLATLGGDVQRADYVALSRRYGIASPSLSFVVLELPGDYLAAGIEPPANYPAEERDDFLRQRKAIDAEVITKRNDWLEHIVQQWGDQVIWWKTKFDPSAQPKRIATSQHFDRPAMNGSAGVPAPAPPPASAPPSHVVAPSLRAPRPPPSGRSALETVTVTSAKIGGDVQNVPISITALSQEQLTSSDNSSGDDRNGGASVAPPAIQIDAWEPDRPYLELYDGNPADFDERFLEAEKRHGSLPIFYLDTAEWLRKHGRMTDAIEMVLSALELPSANEVTLGIVADRLERYGAIDRAIELRERQAMLDPDRPQPKRLLALALARRAALEPAHARADLERAIQLLYNVAVTPQDSAWDGIELIALDEANALLPHLHRLGGSVTMDPRLVTLLDVDERVVIDWTTDATDMDLWVDEPNGERAIYNNPHTAIGGRLSHDMTRGYGPEEYILHHAPSGTYLVQSNVYAPDRLDPNGATILTAHLFRDFGRPTQREDSIDVELTRDDKGSKTIGRLVIPGGAKGMKNSKLDTGGSH